MLAATALFAVMTAAVKVARVERGALEVMLWRSAVALPFAYFAVQWRSKTPVLDAFRVQDRRGVLARSALGFLAMFSYFSAAKGLAVADLSLVMRLQPIGVAVLAPWLLGVSERPGARVWTALILGLGGGAMILGPELAIGSQWGLWAAGAALFSAAAHTMLRRVGQTERASVIVFWFQAFSAVAALVALLLGPGFELAPMSIWPALVGAGLCSALGQLALSRAYQLEHAAAVAGAGAVGPLFGLLLDLWVFDHLPGPLVWVGGALVVVSGTLLALRRA